MENIIKEVLTQIVTDEFIYDPEDSPNKAKECSGTIRDRIKEYNYDRYVWVTNLSVGECWFLLFQV